MTNTYKVLGQSAPVASTHTAVYTVPNLTQAVLSTLCVCNAGVSATYRIAVRVAGAALTPEQYLVYDATLNANDSTFLTLGITLGAGDVVSVYASSANVSFNLFGSEIV